MINARITGLSTLAAQLMLESVTRIPNVVGSSLEELEQQATAENTENILGWLRIAEQIAEDFELPAVMDRIHLIRKRMYIHFSERDIHTECRVLLDALNAGMKNQFIYRYPSYKAAILRGWRDDWAPTLRSFPASEADVFAAVDLWALSHGTASVFHSMRVLEHGMNRLAKDLSLTCDVQNWQNIIAQIESSIRSETKTLPRGSLRMERLSFLSQCAKELYYFKDGWRNHVAHNRVIYDDINAQNILDHVKIFMNNISSKLF